MTSRELACNELVELVTGYLENALPAAERFRFEEHLADCPGCTAYLEQMRETIRQAGRIVPADLSPEAEEALLAAFRDWRNGG